MHHLPVTWQPYGATCRHLLAETTIVNNTTVHAAFHTWTSGKLMHWYHYSSSTYSNCMVSCQNGNMVWHCAMCATSGGVQTDRQTDRKRDSDTVWCVQLEVGWDMGHREEEGQWHCVMCATRGGVGHGTQRDRKRDSDTVWCVQLEVGWDMGHRDIGRGTVTLCDVCNQGWDGTWDSDREIGSETVTDYSWISQAICPISWAEQYYYVYIFTYLYYTALCTLQYKCKDAYILICNSLSLSPPTSLHHHHLHRHW